MEQQAQQILRGEIDLYNLDMSQLHYISNTLGRPALSSSTPQSYLIDRILSQAFSFAEDDQTYTLIIPLNVRLANLIAYYPDSDQQPLFERVMNGEIEPLCCNLNVIQLEAISDLLDIPLPEGGMMEEELTTVLIQNIREAIFSIQDDELELGSNIYTEPPRTEEDMMGD